MTLQSTPAANIQPLPAFDGNGNLPVGDYWPTQAAFEETFVDVVGSRSRREIYEGFRRHRSELLSCGLLNTATCLLDGSFTTSKLNPGDIDLVVEVDPMTIDPTKEHRLLELLSGPGAKPEFHCDAYPLWVLDPSDPDYHAVTVGGREYWHKWFARDRNGNSKGRIWSDLGGFK